MDNLVGMHDLFSKISGFLVVHRPDLLNPVVVRLLKSLVLLLQVLEPSCELLVFVSEPDVLLLES